MKIWQQIHDYLVTFQIRAAKPSLDERLSLSFGLPQGRNSAVTKRRFPGTNQHEVGEMDPFLLVMFISFDAGELMICMNPNLLSKYSKAQIAVNQHNKHTLHTHSCRVKLYTQTVQRTPFSQNLNSQFRRKICSLMII